MVPLVIPPRLLCPAPLRLLLHLLAAGFGWGPGNAGRLTERQLFVRDR